jgi:ABC-type uncharacterized transport system substrate-binding protein
MEWKRRWRSPFLAGLLGSCLAGPAAAHPHVFIEDSVLLLFGERDVAGLRISWTFDEMYSSMLRTDYVKGKNRALTPAEVHDIEQNNFVAAADANFFLDLAVNGEPLAVKKVEDFAVTFRDGKMTFAFTVPLPPSGRDVNEIAIVSFDSAYYIEFTLAPTHGVAIDKGAPFAAECGVTRDVERASKIGPVLSDVVKCTYRRKA